MTHDGGVFPFWPDYVRLFFYFYFCLCWPDESESLGALCVNARVGE